MNRFTQLVVACLLTACLSNMILGGQAPAAQPPQAATPPPAPLQQAAPVNDPNATISLRLPGADLLQVVSIIATELKMNWVADPAIKGTVTINTMGDVKRSDLLPLLQLILRMNGATAVESNGLWRIVQIKDANRAPITPQIDAKTFPVDDRLILNVVPLHYASAADLSKLISNYLSDAGSIVVQESGNILLITDTSRSMQRVMDLIALFDSDSFAGQRVRLFPAKNSSSYGLAADLTQVFSAYAAMGKSAIQFIPIERLNGVLVISPNPASFPEVEKWVAQLDVATRTGGLRNYVYKVQNSHADDLASVLVQLYGGYSNNLQRTGRNGGRGGGGAVAMPMPGGPNGTPGNTTGNQLPTANFGSPAATPSVVGAPTRLAGTPQANGTGNDMYYGPRIVPDIVNNMLIVQCTPPEWEEIRTTLKDLDIVPRQVLIEAQIFEVDLTGDLSMGVTAFLQARDATNRTLTGSFAPPAGSSGTPVLSAAVGQLVGHSRELLTFLTATENRGRTKVVSAPSILASDNQEARIDVGTTVPILTSVGYTGAQQTGGGSIFTNGISQQETGVILSVTPRINAGGLVSLAINQEVSVAGPPPSAAIPSPTIQKRSVATQVTVQDGETIALGGIIQDTSITSRSRVPLLGDIPYLGAIFGTTTTSHQRTELIVLMTPHVVRDLNELTDVTDELKQKLKGLQKMIRRQEKQDNKP